MEFSEYVTHEVLGRVGWVDRTSYWFTDYRIPSGARIELLINPAGHENRVKFLDRAAELVQWSTSNHSQMLMVAIEDELLELYNDVWREPDRPHLSADDLWSCLIWGFLAINNSDVVPVEFGFSAEPLFPLHDVMVKVNSNLTYRGIDLVG